MRYRFSKIKWASRFYVDKRGQSLVEFALTVPILTLLIVGTLDLGRAYFAYMSITNAAREGARYAVNYPPNSYSAQIIARAKNEVDPNFINVTNLTVTATCNVTCGRKDTAVVQVTYPFRLFTTVVFGGGTITLTAKQQMEIIAGQ